MRGFGQLSPLTTTMAARRAPFHSVSSDQSVEEDGNDDEDELVEIRSRKRRRADLSSSSSVVPYQIDAMVGESVRN